MYYLIEIEFSEKMELSYIKNIFFLHINHLLRLILWGLSQVPWVPLCTLIYVLEMKHTSCMLNYNAHVICLCWLLKLKTSKIVEACLPVSINMYQYPNGSSTRGNRDVTGGEKRLGYLYRLTDFIVTQSCWYGPVVKYIYKYVHIKIGVLIKQRADVCTSWGEGRVMKWWNIN